MQPGSESSVASPRRRTASAVCALFAALAVVAGMFGTLYRASMTTANGGVTAVEAHSWHVGVEFGIPRPGPTMGYPLVFAVLMLFAAAVLSRPARTVRVAGVVTAAATTFLAGIVWSIGLQMSSRVGWMREIEIMMAEEDSVIEWDVGPGLGLLLVAVAFAVAATVLAFLPARGREPEDPYQADLTTPPFGIPISEPVTRSTGD